MNSLEENLRKLDYAKKNFEKWNLDKFVIAVNSLEIFLRIVYKYESIEKIPKDLEESLMQILKLSVVLDGSLTEQIIKGQSFPLKQTTVDIEREPKIVYKHLDDTDTKSEWVRFCLVQLDYSLQSKSLEQEFGYTLENQNRVRNKIFAALEIAKSHNANIICFPELSFSKEWLEEIKDRFKEMIIIGGSYYDEGYNVCPIIINGEYIDPPYRKHCPSTLESPKTTGRGMKSGNIFYIFQTKCGRFSVLNCMDYTDQSYPICRYEAKDKRKGVDYIINPCNDRNIYRFQSGCNSDCQNYDISVIQINRANDASKYGGTCIIGKEHEDILQKLKDQRFKPEDDIKYKLIQIDGEIIIIADLNIKMKAPSVSLPIGYSGRISISRERCYKYVDDQWIPMA